MRFKIVNQNQYPLGVALARYGAPKCEATSTTIVVQSRGVGSRFIYRSIEKNSEKKNFQKFDKKKKK